MFALVNEFMRGQRNDRLLLKWVQESGVFQFAGCLGRRVEFKGRHRQTAGGVGIRP